MNGRIIKKGHECDPPSGEEDGAVWRCDCGRHWQAYRSGWLLMSLIHVLFMNLSARRKAKS